MSDSVKTLADYGAQVQADLTTYAAQLRTTTEWEFGAAVTAEIEHFLRVLLGQSPMPGVLVLLGYAMEDGDDQAMIIRAARAVAMLHAVVSMQQSGDPLIQNAARAGEHAAQILLANLEVDAEVNRRAVSIMNRTLLLSAHAQTVQAQTPDAPQVLEWRALELAVNPLHVGMVLAGADCHATDDITPVVTDLGKAMATGDTQAITTILEDIVK